MRKIIVIGTVHNMLPKHKDELESILKKINPDQVFVEIDREIDVKSKEIDTFPKEMIFAYKWAIKNDKQVDCFDTDRYGNQLKGSVTKEELKSAERAFLTIFKDYDWKKMNDPDQDDEKRWLEIEDRLIDAKKVDARRKAMLNNIRELAIKKGTIVILTGAAHLKFFEKHLKRAVFPYR